MYNFLFIIITSLYTPCQDINTLRDDYFAIQTEEQIFNFISKYRDNTCHQGIPYIAFITMRQAEHLSSYFKKYSYYKKGKTMLEQYIKAHPENIEARYIRVIIQRNIPSYLGYNDNIDTDILYINQHINSYHLDDKYKKLIHNHLKK